jgi:hypothetical protein
VLVIVDWADVEKVSLVGIDTVEVVGKSGDISDGPNELAVINDDCNILVVSAIVAEAVIIVLSYELENNFTYHAK